LGSFICTRPAFVAFVTFIACVVLGFMVGFFIATFVARGFTGCMAGFFTVAFFIASAEGMLIISVRKKKNLFCL
jgi:hypothetical protein